MKEIIYNIDTLKINSALELVIEGWILAQEEYKINIYTDQGKEYEVQSKNVERKDIVEVYQTKENYAGFHSIIHLADLDFNVLILKIVDIKGNVEEVEKSIKELTDDVEIIKYTVDDAYRVNDKWHIIGWAFGVSGNRLGIAINNEIDYEVIYNKRMDVKNAFKELLEHDEVGFEIIINNKSIKKVEIIFNEGQYKVTKPINLLYYIKRIKDMKRQKMKSILKGIRISSLKKACLYLKTHGIKAVINKVKFTLKGEKIQKIDYNEWLISHLPTKGMLQEQRKVKFDYEPKISIVVPTYNTPKQFLLEMIDSVINQTYSNWELCIADGNSIDVQVKEILKDYKRRDKRIKVKFLDENKGIAGNTNECISLCIGEYIGLFDHDDLLTANALYEVVLKINQDREIDFIYSDEDKVDEYSKEYFDPHFKQDWAPDTFRSYNYICHFTVFKRSLLDEVGIFNPEFDGSQDYDMILRLTEKANKIEHISKVLYHWRVHKNSTAANIGAKEYTITAAKRALQAHLDRQGIEGTIEPGLLLGTHRVRYDIKENFKVSIIIPSKDHIDDLSKCIASIRKSTYINYEVIIVENNSEEAETFAYYEELKEQKDIKVVIWEKEFNYSAINNYAAQYATGEYIILLNNDIQILSPNWIEEMLMHCQREEIGLVGVKLYYPDDTVQHAGVIIGIGGVAGHSHKYYGRNDHGYFSRLKIIQNLSAVTAACLMIRRDVFDNVGGLEEKFAVAFNDIDLCLKVRALDKFVIFTPYVEAYHYESKSRGIEDSPEKIARFNKEIELFERKWGLYKYDPYYNINLTKKREDFSLQ